jgi:glycosyltransferase involved in cell wall biosynthesis
VPCRSSRIPGYREVIADDASLAVPPGDEAALADAVCGIVSDEPRREAMGKAARAIAVERYSWPGVARSLERVYSEVTGIGVGEVVAA